jgi:hypothetical protein
MSNKTLSYLPVSLDTQFYEMKWIEITKSMRRAHIRLYLRHLTKKDCNFLKCTVLTMTRVSNTCFYATHNMLSVINLQ